MDNALNSTQLAVYAILRDSLEQSVLDVNLDRNILLEDEKEVSNTFFDQEVFLIGYKCMSSVLSMKDLESWKTRYISLISFIKKTILEGYRIQQKLSGLGIVTGLAKGFVLSEYLYKTPYMRQFDDLDFHVNKENFKDAYYSMVKDNYVLTVNSYIPNVLELDIEAYLKTSTDLSFNSNGFIKSNIEIKTQDEESSLFPELISRVNRKRQHAVIENRSYSVFDEITTLYYLLTNAYKNHFTDWGILHSKTIRDIYDIAVWVNDHPEWDYSFLRSLSDEFASTDCIQRIVSLTYSIFDNINSSSMESFSRFFDYMEFDKEKELNRIFNVEWRYEDYYRHIQDHIIPKESSHLVQNQKIRLLPRIRIPLKEYIPTFFAYYSEDKRITLSISGFAKNVKHSVSLVIWDKLYKEPRLYKRNVNVEVYLGRVESFETEIETVSYPTVNEDYLTLSFPITDNIIWFNDKGYMILFELYLYWPNITNPIYHWANVGNGYRPYQLIIDN